MTLFDHMSEACSRLTKGQIIDYFGMSRTQLYKWIKEGIGDRKQRKCKVIPEETAENAVKVIIKYPHFGGRKGQIYMIYHRLGYIAMKSYDDLKRSVKRLLTQEMSARRLFALKEAYEHQKPYTIGEIWAQDITGITVEGVNFKVALLIDTYSQYLLGVSVARRESVQLVSSPVEQALAFNNGMPPKKFLLSDNGSVYVSDKHGKLLKSEDIIHKRIPSCRPQYNGSVECGGKEFKNIFYNVWAKREADGTDKEKSLRERVYFAVKETANVLNNEIPRPSLGGISPTDVHNGNASEKIKANHKYMVYERGRKNIPPWKRNYWDVLKDALGLKTLTNLEVKTKFFFFCRRPLRKIAKIQPEGVR